MGDVTFTGSAHTIDYLLEFLDDSENPVQHITFSVPLGAQVGGVAEYDSGEMLVWADAAATQMANSRVAALPVDYSYVIHRTVTGSGGLSEITGP